MTARAWLPVALAVSLLALAFAPALPVPRSAEIASGYARQLVGLHRWELPVDSPAGVVRGGARHASVAPLAVAQVLPSTLLRTPALASLLGVLVALAGVLVALWALADLLAFVQASRGATLLTLAAVALGSPLVVYARTNDATTWAAAGLVLALSGLTRLRPVRFTIGVVLTALAAPALFGVGVLLVVRALTEPRLRRVAVVVIASLALYASRLADVGVAGAPLVEGLVGLVGSPGKGLLFYMPLLFVAWRGLRPLAARDEALAEDVVLVVLVALFAVAGRDDWHGDPGWGPRHLVPLLPLVGLPLAAALDARRLAPALVVVLALVGFVLQQGGLVIDGAGYAQMLASVRAATGAGAWFNDPPGPASDRHFIPQFSPLVGHAFVLWHKLRGHAPTPAESPWKLLLPSSPSVDPSYHLLVIDWWAAGAARLWRILVADAALFGAALALVWGRRSIDGAADSR